MISVRRQSVPGVGRSGASLARIRSGSGSDRTATGSAGETTAPGLHAAAAGRSAGPSPPTPAEP